jgi:hypothetical protein
MRKIEITYKMNKGKHERAESFIELPVSEERYEELAKGLTDGSKAWNEVRAALKTIARLQGYTLGAWSVNLEIQT